MYNLLARLGQNPKRSLTIFLCGFGLFIVGLCFIAVGYFYHHLWQVLGIIIIVFACIIAAWGYLGIFANRWFTILNRNKPKRHPTTTNKIP
jgi:hypothetical protein